MFRPTRPQASLVRLCRNYFLLHDQPFVLGGFRNSNADGTTLGESVCVVEDIGEVLQVSVFLEAIRELFHGGRRRARCGEIEHKSCADSRVIVAMVTAALEVS